MNKRLSPAHQSACSMNYLFLQSVAGKINHDMINREIANYLECIDEKYYAVDKPIKDEIIGEIQSGKYFDGLTKQEIERKINSSIKKIVGSIKQNAAFFYMNLIETAHKQQKGA